MPVIDTSALLRPSFAESEFTSTKWDTAADKAQFANSLCRFIAADFKQDLFTKKLYRRLSLTFGHIAHFNLHGFFEYFFLDQQGKIAFLEQTLAWWMYGDPHYTFCDVERAVQARLQACNLLEAYRALRAAEVEQAERALLALLHRKYEGQEAPAPSVVPVLHPGSSPKTSREKPAEQQGNLF
jgi:hypothetical protein